MSYDIYPKTHIWYKKKERETPQQRGGSNTRNALWYICNWMSISNGYSIGIVPGIGSGENIMCDPQCPAVSILGFPPGLVLRCRQAGGRTSH